MKETSLLSVSYIYIFYCCTRSEIQASVMTDGQIDHTFTRILCICNMQFVFTQKELNFRDEHWFLIIVWSLQPAVNNTIYI
jgi:hypothetical protein